MSNTSQTGDEQNIIADEGRCVDQAAAEQSMTQIEEQQSEDSILPSCDGSERQNGVDLKKLLEFTFDCSIKDIRFESPLTLAYIGDAVYDLIIRTVVVERANRSPKELHKATVKYVNAATQARMIEALEPELTEEETAVFHRGRNAKSGTSAKNASIVDYRKATGFEAVMGYLYLQGDLDRAVKLIKKALDTIGLEL